MGTMTFRGRYVKRHFKDRETGLIKVVFFDGAPTLVSYEEWRAGSKMVGHSGGIRRCEVTRAKVLI